MPARATPTPAATPRVPADPILIGAPALAGGHSHRSHAFPARARAPRPLQSRLLLRAPFSESPASYVAGVQPPRGPRPLKSRPLGHSPASFARHSGFQLRLLSAQFLPSPAPPEAPPLHRPSQSSVSLSCQGRTTRSHAFFALHGAEAPPLWRPVVPPQLRPRPLARPVPPSLLASHFVVQPAEAPPLKQMAPGLHCSTPPF